MGSIHHKFDRPQYRIKHKRDRTNSLSESKTASETLCHGSICRGRPPTRKQMLKQAGAEKPRFSASREKSQLCLVGDSMNRSIFGILETSTQLS
ncbi:hypothetical protein QUB29_19020 [Microcoleus sp. B4b_D2]|uniref:hypothetical protein n=1 Tax=unclassified Microcoleus TaxID=2642155 RepID=UPI002FD0619D